MRFHQLSVGQRFRFQGETYTKQDTLMSVHAGSGQRRLIKRSAEVAPLPEDSDPVPAAPADDTLSAIAVHTAFDAFYERCRQLLAECGSDGHRREALEADLAKARQKFLMQLENSNS